MKNLIVFCFALLGITNAYSQNKPGNNDKVYTIAQVKPTFIGDFNKYLSDDIVYPKDAKDNHVEGTVYVSFIVEKDGSVDSVKVTRGYSHSLDAEAIRVIASSPKWKPAVQNGEAVRFKYVLPIHFNIPDDNSSKSKKSN